MEEQQLCASAHAAAQRALAAVAASKVGDAATDQLLEAQPQLPLPLSQQLAPRALKSDPSSVDAFELGDVRSQAPGGTTAAVAALRARVSAVREFERRQRDEGCAPAEWVEAITRASTQLAEAETAVEEADKAPSSASHSALARAAEALACACSTLQAAHAARDAHHQAALVAAERARQGDLLRFAERRLDALAAGVVGMDADSPPQLHSAPQRAAAQRAVRQLSEARAAIQAARARVAAGPAACELLEQVRCTRRCVAAVGALSATVLGWNLERLRRAKVDLMRLTAAGLPSECAAPAEQAREEVAAGEACMQRAGQALAGQVRGNARQLEVAEARGAKSEPVAGSSLEAGPQRGAGELVLTVLPDAALPATRGARVSVLFRHGFAEARCVVSAAAEAVAEVAAEGDCSRASLPVLEAVGEVEVSLWMTLAAAASDAPAADGSAAEQTLLGATAVPLAALADAVLHSGAQAERELELELQPVPAPDAGVAAGAGAGGAAAATLRLRAALSLPAYQETALAADVEHALAEAARASNAAADAVQRLRRALASCCAPTLLAAWETSAAAAVAALKELHRAAAADALRASTEDRARVLRDGLLEQTEPVRLLCAQRRLLLARVGAALEAAVGHALHHRLLRERLAAEERSVAAKQAARQNIDAYAAAQRTQRQAALQAASAGATAAQEATQQLAAALAAAQREEEEAREQQPRAREEVAAARARCDQMRRLISPASSAAAAAAPGAAERHGPLHLTLRVAPAEDDTPLPAPRLHSASPPPVHRGMPLSAEAASDQFFGASPAAAGAGGATSVTFSWTDVAAPAPTSPGSRSSWVEAGAEAGAEVVEGSEGAVAAEGTESAELPDDSEFTQLLQEADALLTPSSRP